MKYEELDSITGSQDKSVCYISDRENYELIYLNKRGMESLNLKSPEEYRGKKCYHILQGKEEPCPYCTNHLLKQGEKYCWEHYNEKIGKWVEIEDTLINMNGKLYRLEKTWPMEDQSGKVRRLADKLTVEDVLLDCIRALALEDDHEAAFDRFLERVGRFYRAERASIYEIDYENKQISSTHEWCAPRIEPRIEAAQGISLDRISDWLVKFKREGELFIVSREKEMDHSSEEYQLLLAHATRSLLAVPLYLGGRISGFIAVSNPTNKKADLTLLRAASNFATEEMKKYHLIHQLERASYTDALTRINNRNKYVDVLRQYDSNPPASLGVVYVDVNGMKNVNDTYGHQYGDKVLLAVSGILREFGGDNTYRIGGDEFVILFVDMVQEEFQRVLMRLKQRFDDDDRCDVSIGCVWAEGQVDVSAQIAQADELMYAEKQNYYHEALNRGQMVRSGIFNEVAKEIAKKRFMVYYQPQVELKTGRVIGAEALVRKLSAEGTLVPPDKFIPYYELEGVIRHVDLFVFRQVCLDMQRWKQRYPNLKISVNFSRVTLMENQIVEHIVDICREYGIESRNIVIEVTESISKLSHEQLNGLIEQLGEAGFTLSLDDFGSKYSNLSILNDMNFNTVKLDKTLVDKIESNRKSQAIIRNIINMCGEIEVDHVLAEGIETELQKNMLADYRCEFGQGYYFSRPIPMEQFERFLEDNRT